MAMRLSTEIEERIQRYIDAGAFENEDDVISEALRLLEQRENKRSGDERNLRPSEALALHRDEVRGVFKGREMRNPRLFGSVARGEDQIESDLDILVDSTPRTSLFDLANIEIALEKLLGVRVEVMTINFLPEKDRARVLAEAEAL